MARIIFDLSDSDETPNGVRMQMSHDIGDVKAVQNQELDATPAMLAATAMLKAFHDQSKPAPEKPEVNDNGGA